MGKPKDIPIEEFTTAISAILTPSPVISFQQKYIGDPTERHYAYMFNIHIQTDKIVGIILTEVIELLKHYGYDFMEIEKKGKYIILHFIKYI